MSTVNKVREWNRTRKRQIPFWCITISMLIGLPLPLLFQHGMFMDAVQYSAVAHNLANGIGTFWFPQFTLHNIAGLPAFHEQPPLSFGIQAIFFKVFGSSYMVERFYTMIIYFLTTFLLIKIWRSLFFDNQSIRSISWIPLLFWILIPQVFWSFSNNMIENTLGVFILLSVLLQINYFHQGRSFINIIIAAIAIFLATLTKGVPGLFPLVIPFLYWVALKNVRFKKILYSTVVLFLIPVTIYAILLLFESSGESLRTYFYERLIYRINENPTVTSRLYILRRAIEESLIPLIITVLILGFARYKNIKAQIKILPASLFILAIGLSGILPLMLTKVQRVFYIVPALPFIALSFAILSAPYVAHFIESKLNTDAKGYKYFRILSQVLLLGAVVSAFIKAGDTKRDNVMLKDVHVIGKSIEEGSILSTTPEIFWFDWSMQSYLSRHYFLVADTLNTHTYFLIEKGRALENSNFSKVDLPLAMYDLYKKNKTK